MRWLSTDLAEVGTVGLQLGGFTDHLHRLCDIPHL